MMTVSIIDTLRMVRARLKAQLDVGIVSNDPANEDPQHEFAELIPDLDDAISREADRLARLKVAAEFMKSPGLAKVRVEGKWISRRDLFDNIEAAL